MINKISRHLAGMVAILGLLVVTAGTAQAYSNSLNLTKTWPDIFAGDLGVTFDPGLDPNFMIDGIGDFTLTLTEGGAVQTLSNASFSITADITSADGGFSMGNLEIRENFNQDLVLSGDLEDLGFYGTNDVDFFEFVFSTTGGSQQAAFGDRVGVIVDAGNIAAFNGAFDLAGTGFSTAAIGGGVSDTFPTQVPVPGSLALMALGLVAGLGRLGRRRTV